MMKKFRPVRFVWLWWTMLFANVYVEINVRTSCEVEKIRAAKWPSWTSLYVTRKIYSFNWCSNFFQYNFSVPTKGWELGRKCFTGFYRMTESKIFSSIPFFVNFLNLIYGKSEEWKLQQNKFLINYSFFSNCRLRKELFVPKNKSSETERNLCPPTWQFAWASKSLRWSRRILMDFFTETQIWNWLHLIKSLFLWSLL